MANTKKAKPIPMNKFIQSLSDPWANLSSALRSVPTVYYNSPDMSALSINYDVQNRLKGDSKARTSHRATWDELYANDTNRVTIKPSASSDYVQKPTKAGLLTWKNYNQEQMNRLDPATTSMVRRVLTGQEYIESTGDMPIEQRSGTTNRVMDILDRFQYAGATNQKENSLGKVDLFERYIDFTRSFRGDVLEKISGNRSSDQIEYDAGIQRIRDMNKALADPHNDPVAIKAAYAEFLDNFAMKFSFHHPGVAPGYDIKRPEGEYVNYSDSKTHKKVQRKVDKGKTDIIPSFIPINATEAASWAKGFTGHSKTTYAENYTAKGYDPTEAAFMGLFHAGLTDPFTYVTGGFGNVASLGSKALRLGGIAKDAIVIKDFEEAKRLHSLIDTVLTGKTIKHGDRSFTFGKNDAQGFEDFVSGGSRTGRDLSSTRVAEQEKAIIKTITTQINTHLKANYGELHKSLKTYQKALKVSQDPVVIEQAYVNLARQVASMQKDKAVADTLENLLRQGDTLKEVPMPKPFPVQEVGGTSYRAPLKPSVPKPPGYNKEDDMLLSSDPENYKSSWQYQQEQVDRHNEWAREQRRSPDTAALNELDSQNLNEGAYDASLGAETSAETASRMSRLKYTEEWVVKHTANAARKIGKTARRSFKGNPRIPVASRVMTYTSYMGMSAKQTVRDTLELARINDASIQKTLTDYTEYMTAHGNDATKTLNAEDLATSTALQGQRLVAPEVKAMMDLFDIGKVNINEGRLAKMFKAMGYSDEQTFRAISKYRAALADDISSKGLNWYSAETRLVDKSLDWAPVGITRANNAKVVNEAIKIVEEQTKTITANVASAMAETSIRFAEKAGIKRSFELRLAGIPLVHMQTPERVGKMLDEFLQGDARIAESMRRVDAWTSNVFKGYSSVGAELNLARTATIGRGEQIIHSILGELNKEWVSVPRKMHKPIFDAWVSGKNPETWEKYGSQLAALDGLYADLGSYARGILRLGPEEDLSVVDFAAAMNKHLPGGFKFDAKKLETVAQNSKEELLSPEFFKNYYKSLTPSVKRGVHTKGLGISALDATWAMRVSAEKGIAESALLQGIEDTWGLKKFATNLDPAAKKILTTGPDAWRPIKGYGFKSDIYFPPELHSDVQKLLNIVTHKNTSEVATNTFGKSTMLWKAYVTVYNIPQYFIRNGISDGFMMYFAGAAPTSLSIGPRVLAHTELYRDLLRTNPEFTKAFTLADKNNATAMHEAISLADAAYNPKPHTAIISFKSGFTQEGGPTITNMSSIDLLHEYYKYGLETNFVRTSLNAVRGKFRRTGEFLGDPIKNINAWGEDARRLSLFADGLRLAEKRGIKSMDQALEFAAERTRKYLFDYSDFTNIERNFIGALVPFYKWTRKAVPLMVEMLLFKPGKASLPMKIQSAINTANGQTPDSLNYSWVPRMDGVVPSWQYTNPQMYLGDNIDAETGVPYGTYGSIPNPMNEILSKYIDPAVGLLDPLIPGTPISTNDPNASTWDQMNSSWRAAFQAGISPISPEVRLPFEWGMGSQAFGGNELGGRPVESGLDSIKSLFPQIRQAQNIFQQGTPDTPSEIGDMLGLINVQKNTPASQRSQLAFLQTLIDKRKKIEEMSSNP